MTPKLQVRTFTNDQYVLDKIFYSNFYRMRGFKTTERKPVVVDIGAHCGYFCFTALSLGAKKVYAFEPFTPNYKMLLANVGDNPIGTVIPYQLGVYVAPICLPLNYPQVIHNSFFDFANVGLDTNHGSPEVCKCCVMPLDDLLQHYIEEQVDLLKLSIGYGEMAILDGSKRLSTQVCHICGEIALPEDGLPKLQASLANHGFTIFKTFPVTGEEHRWLFLASREGMDPIFTEEAT
jgi:FkbM family methyltransferase